MKKTIPQNKKPINKWACKDDTTAYNKTTEDKYCMLPKSINIPAPNKKKNIKQKSNKDE